MKMMFAVPWPPQGLFSNKPLHSGADFRGTKMRAAHPAGSRLAVLLQAQPITIHLPELPQALSTGMVHIFPTAAVAAMESKLYEHTKYFYDVKAWLPKNVVVVNQKAFDALDAATQSALLKAAATAETRGWATSEQKDSEAVKALSARGVNVETPSVGLMKELRAIGATLTAEWGKTAGADGKAIIEAFNRM
jgi:TRAP-type C4-dicarboxylate transport system substrate-binding protein